MYKYLSLNKFAFTFFQIYSTVTKDGSGIQIAKDLCKNHAAEVLKDLQEIPDGEAKIALIRIVNYILNK